MSAWKTSAELFCGVPVWGYPVQPSAYTCSVSNAFNIEKDLQTAMAQGGLQVGDLRVQPAPGDRLPVSDLVLRRRSDDALVDVHA